MQLVVVHGDDGDGEDEDGGDEEDDTAGLRNDTK